MTTKLSLGTTSHSHRCVICEAEIPCDNPEDAQYCLVSAAAGAPALLLGWSRPPKPLECMERLIRNHEGDVYDPFVGSGTTIIAAERQGRACYAMEIEPRYVDTAIARWEQYTGEKAKLV